MIIIFLLDGYSVYSSTVQQAEGYDNNIAYPEPQMAPSIEEQRAELFAQHQ